MTTPQVQITQSAQATVEVASAADAVVEVTAPAAPLIVEINVPGPQGPPGDAGSTYVHTQETPSVTWIINHNLGIKPSVELLNSGSQEIEGDVVHTSSNQVIVSFTSPISGLARLT